MHSAVRQIFANKKAALLLFGFLLRGCGFNEEPQESQNLQTEQEPLPQTPAAQPSLPTSSQNQPSGSVATVNVPITVCSGFSEKHCGIGDLANACEFVGSACVKKTITPPPPPPPPLPTACSDLAANAANCGKSLACQVVGTNCVDDNTYRQPPCQGLSQSDCGSANPQCIVDAVLPNVCLNNPAFGRCVFDVDLCDRAGGDCGAQDYNGHCANTVVPDGQECVMQGNLCGMLTAENPTGVKLRVDAGLGIFASLESPPICQANNAETDAYKQQCQARVADSLGRAIVANRFGPGAVAPTPQQKADYETTACARVFVQGVQSAMNGVNTANRLLKDQVGAYPDGIDWVVAENQDQNDVVERAGWCHMKPKTKNICGVNIATVSASTLCNKQTKQECENVKIGVQPVCVFR